MLIELWTVCVVEKLLIFRTRNRKAFFFSSNRLRNFRSNPDDASHFDSINNSQSHTPNIEAATREWKSTIFISFAAFASWSPPHFVDDSYFFHYCKIDCCWWLIHFHHRRWSRCVVASFVVASGRSLERAKERKANDVIVQTIMCKHELLVESLGGWQLCTVRFMSSDTFSI